MRVHLSILGALALFSACGGDSNAIGPPNVVLIVIDTLRADHLSCYGYGLPTSPSIDRLAATSDLYTRCRATGPWTLPSHASMFTGRFAFQHRARTELRPDGLMYELPLSEEHATLAELLGSAGYRTGAFAANVAYLRQEYQLDQGFGTYEVEREPAIEKARDAVKWMEEEGSAPFFLFVNFMDTHRPYNVSPLPGDRAEGLPAPAESHPGKLLDELCADVMDLALPNPTERVSAVISQYDTAIAHADVGVEAIVAHLEASGQLENTILIVTSDHGEYFGEHGLVEHSKDLYEEAMHVPLILKRPGQAEGQRRDEHVSLADVPGLVARELPLELAAQARLQFPLDPARNFTIAEVSFSRQRDLEASYGQRFLRERKALYSGKFKLIWSSDGQHELYNLELDPNEARNIIREKPVVVERLGKRLEQYMKDNASVIESAAPVTLDAEALKSLQGLGYLGDSDDEDGS